MSSTLDRLRRLHGLRPQKSRSEPPTTTSAALRSSEATSPDVTSPDVTLPDVTEVDYTDASTDGTQPAISAHTTYARQTESTLLETLVPGEVIENANGTCYVVTERYPLKGMRGAKPLADLLHHHPSTFADFHPNFGLHESIDFRQALFIDTETTGLGSGAGVYAFMVGVGTFEQENTEETNVGITTPTHFVVRQYFMRHPGEEGALMLALSELLDAFGMSVTFNGRTFDLPLLRTRLRQNQHMYPELRGSGRLLAADRPHLDLLHPARRIWKRRLQSCRLINLETEILGLTRSGDDVPGHLIPQLYTEYLQSNNASALGGIFYHNREDIVSMVALATELSTAYRACEEATPDTMHGLDWFSLARCLIERQRYQDAERALTIALEQLVDSHALADTFAALAQLQKQQGRWEEATATWQRWLSTVPGFDLSPYIELAKYCEWQIKDLEQAEMWTSWALHTLQSAPAWQQPQFQHRELEHRLTRIQRKRKRT